jgi:hypothetical protein
MKKLLLLLIPLLLITSVSATTDTVGNSGSYNTVGFRNFLNFAPIWASNTGTLTSLGLNISDSGILNITAIGLYADNGTAPTTLLTANYSIMATTFGWFDIPVPATTIIAGTKYWIVADTNATTNFHQYENNLGTYISQAFTLGTNLLPNPFVQTSANATGQTYLYRMTYLSALGNCTDGTIFPTLNYTILDENTLLNVYGNVQMTHNLVNSSSYSFTFNNQTSFANCLNSTSSYQDNAVIQYVDNGTAYTTRYFWLDNRTINNTAQTINLYLLPTAQGSAVSIALKDSSGTAITNAYVQIQRYYPNVNAYRIIEILPTDVNGMITAFLQLNTAYYRFVITRNGVVIGTIPQQFITTTSLTLNLNSNVQSSWLQYWNQITGNVTYNYANGNITAVYQDTSGYLVNATLTVSQIGALVTSTLCSITNTSIPTGSMVCYIGNATGNVFSYTLSGTLSNGDTNNIATGTLQYAQTSILFGNCSNPANALGCQDGMILTFFLVLVCILIGVTISPATSLILMCAALGISSIIGLYTVSLDTLVGLFAVVGVIIYKMGRG